MVSSATFPIRRLSPRVPGGAAAIVTVPVWTSFTSMIDYYGPVRSSMSAALVPELPVRGAGLFLGEPLHWNLAAGLAMTTSGLLFGVRAVGRR